MNYEKTDWGHFGKAFGTCAAVLGLATGLALFSSRNPVVAQPLEQVVRKEQPKKEPPKKDIPPFVVSGTPASNLAIIVGDAADTMDVIGSAESIYAVGGPIYRKEASPELARLASEKISKGDYKIYHDNKKGMILGYIVLEGKEYGFKSIDGKLERIDDYSIKTEYRMPKDK